ncbi:unnamed protein product, partial [marine sediment metagenome]
LFFSLQSLSVMGDHILRANLCAKFGDGFAIHLDGPELDQCISFPA